MANQFPGATAPLPGDTIPQTRIETVRVKNVTSSTNNGILSGQEGDLKIRIKRVWNPSTRAFEDNARLPSAFRRAELTQNLATPMPKREAGAPIIEIPPLSMLEAIRGATTRETLTAILEGEKRPDMLEAARQRFDQIDSAARSRGGNPIAPAHQQPVYGTQNVLPADAPPPPAAGNTYGPGGEILTTGQQPAQGTPELPPAGSAVAQGAGASTGTKKGG